MQVAVGDVDDFLADIHAVVTVYFLNLVYSDDIRPVDAQKTVFGQHALYGFHHQMGDERFGLIVEIEQHVVFHAVDIDDLVDSHVSPLIIDSDEDGVGLLRLRGGR